jgi:hypothetical protein
MEIKNPSDYMQQAPGLLALHLPPSHLLDCQIISKSNRLEGYYSSPPHFRKIVKISKSKFHPVLQVSKTKTKKQKTYLEYYNTQLDYLSYYNGAFTLDVKSMLNVNLGGILGGT